MHLLGLAHSRTWASSLAGGRSTGNATGSWSARSAQELLGLQQSPRGQLATVDGSLPADRYPHTHADMRLSSAVCPSAVCPSAPTSMRPATYCMARRTCRIPQAPEPPSGGGPLARPRATRSARDERSAPRVRVLSTAHLCGGALPLHCPSGARRGDERGAREGEDRRREAGATAHLAQWRSRPARRALCAARRAAIRRGPRAAVATRAPRGCGRCASRRDPARSTRRGGRTRLRACGRCRFARRSDEVHRARSARHHPERACHLVFGQASTPVSARRWRAWRSRSRSLSWLRAALARMAVQVALVAFPGLALATDRCEWL